MHSGNWEQRLKDMLSEFREENMLYYRLSSSEYSENEQRIKMVQNEIDKLGLEEEVISKIENLLEMESAASSDYIERSYLQGISDCLRFLMFIQEVH